MKNALVAFALCAAVAMAIPVETSLLAQLEEKLSPIRATAQGRFLIEMAVMHAETNNPVGTKSTLHFVEDIINAIIALQDDLQDELKRLDARYTRRSNEHVSIVQILEMNLETSQIDVANSRDTIDNLLQPTLEQTEARLAQLRQNIQDNRDTLAKETVLRNNEHEAFVGRVSEHQEAIDAIDQALQLVGQLVNTPSFAQTVRFAT
jgi:hypothetical protein